MSKGVVYASLETEKNDVGPDGEDEPITVSFPVSPSSRVSSVPFLLGDKEVTCMLFSRNFTCVMMLYVLNNV